MCDSSPQIYRAKQNNWQLVSRRKLGVQCKKKKVLLSALVGVRLTLKACHEDLLS